MRLRAGIVRDQPGTRRAVDDARRGEADRRQAAVAQARRRPDHGGARAGWRGNVQRDAVPAAGGGKGGVGARAVVEARAENRGRVTGWRAGELDHVDAVVERDRRLRPALRRWQRGELARVVGAEADAIEL